VTALLPVATFSMRRRHPTLVWAKLPDMADVWAGSAEKRSPEIGRATGAILRLRLLFLPVILVIALWQWAATSGSAGRLALICAVFALVVLYNAFLFRQRRRGIQTQTLGITSTINLLVFAALTGGLDSPFIIVMPVTATTVAMGGPRRDAWAAAAIQVAGLPLLALAGGTRPIFTSAMVLLGLFVAMYVGFVLRGMFERMLERIERTQEDILRLHHDQMRSLTSLSAEIAGKLRTPLSSIDGMTGRALEEIRDPTLAGERLQGLHAEAARMQKVLEEFLNFSRPISPLSLRTVDGVRIGGEIVELFQGVAQERHLSIALSGTPVKLHCDPRKIKQVLINLVQNAVEASAPGGEIGIEVEPRPEQATIRVLDRGHGLSADVAQRLFQPGVTTKPRGSGLGLTIARSIAEQHGGRLTLTGRAGGGCAAELVIPRAQAHATVAT
jgi:signal transduction histidine kinase